MARTVTIDTGEMLFTDQNGITSYINDATTFIVNIAASGTPRVYTITTTGALGLADGRKIKFDVAYTKFQVEANATARLNAGSIWIEEDNGYKGEWKIRTVTIDNIATPTAITTMVLERCDNPMITCTLSSITVGA